MLIAVAITLPAWGRGDVDFKFGRREAWVGQSFPIQVEVINAADHSPPKIPPIDGATAEVLDAANTSTFTQIINGRRTTRSTVTYTVLIRPERAGLIEIPSIEVVADGETFRSDPWRIVATKSDVGDLMFLDIVASPETAWVGEPVTLTLQIWIKQFRDASQGIALEEESMWSLVDQNDSSWGVFGESLQQMTRERRRPRGREVERNGASYFLYEIPVVRHPIDAGRIDPGDVRVVGIGKLGVDAVNALLYHPQLAGADFYCLDTDAQMLAADENVVTGMLHGFIISLVTAIFIGLALERFGGDGMMSAIKSAVLLWAGFAVTTLAYGLVYAMQPVVLFILDASHLLVGFIVVAVVQTALDGVAVKSEYA